MKKLILALLALLLLLTGCAAVLPEEEELVPAPDPHAGMVEVSGGGALRRWVKKYEELAVNPFLGQPAETAALPGYTVRRGMDLSQYQGTVDFTPAVEAGLDFAILRAGYRGYGTYGQLMADECFGEYLAAVLAAGMDVGAYFFSQAVSVEEAEEEADFLLSLLEPYGPQTFTLPVFFDWEKIGFTPARTDGVSGTVMTDCALAFCTRLRAAGYQTGIYAPRYPAYDDYDLSRVAGETLWIGAVGEVSDFYYAHTFWQYRVTEEGEVPGFDTAVDLDLWFCPTEEA